MPNLFECFISGVIQKLQAKFVNAGTSDITVTPDSGYDAMSEVTVYPTPSESKTVTASSSSQTVTPSSGKYLSSVTVEPQVHSDYSPSSSTYHSYNGGGLHTIDLGSNNNSRYVRVQNTASSSTRYYEAITNVVLSKYWKFNESGYNNQTVSIYVSGLSTGSHYNYILFVCGRNFISATDTSLSVSNGSLTLLRSDTHSYDGATTDNIMQFYFYRWYISGGSTATISINRGSKDYYATYNLTVFN